jgi:hypothetical protein
VHERVDVFELLRLGGAGAVVCGLIGGAIGLASSGEAAERAEHVMWGALLSIIAGGLLGVFVLAPG